MAVSGNNVGFVEKQGSDVSWDNGQGVTGSSEVSEGCILPQGRQDGLYQAYSNACILACNAVISSRCRAAAGMSGVQ